MRGGVLLDRHATSFFASLLIHVAGLLALSMLVLATSENPKRVAIDIQYDPEEADLDTAQTVEISASDFEIRNEDTNAFSVPAMEQPEPLAIRYEELTAAPDRPTPFSTKDLLTIVGSAAKRSGRTSLEFVEGVGQQIGERLEKHGAGTGDVQISIAWDNYNDIDLWVVCGSIRTGDTICWMNRTAMNGLLDIDENAYPTTDQAVENVFWPTGQAPYCMYTVYVDHYHQWDRRASTDVLVRIVHDGQTVVRKIRVTPDGGKVKVYSFRRRPTKHGSPGSDVVSRPSPPRPEPVDPYADLLRPLSSFE